jgi:hypothetical protein
MTDTPIIDPATVPDHAAQLTMAEIDAMTPAQARAMTEALQAKHAARVVAEATAAKTATDAAAGAKTDTEASPKEEPLRPTDADGKAIALPDPGILSSVALDQRRYAEAKDHLEATGFPERGTPVGDDLWGMIEGRLPVSPELQKAAQRKLSEFENDAEFRRKLFAGDPTARALWYNATAHIAAGKIQRPQA